MADLSRAAGVIAAADAGAARRAGLRPGDRVLALDGAPLRDVIDWWWRSDGPAFTVTLERDGSARDVLVERRAGEPLGVTFTETLFTPIRECDNSCAFCFVSQLPPGLRRALYVRDDDFRLSFLSGNFVTLTNVTDEDIARILDQHLSPLHVSVHAVDPDVRARLICPAVDDRALEVLDVLLAGGIEVHVQIVLVPGVNDGAVLDETLAYLSTRQGVVSAGGVPMGYTAHQKRFASSFTRDSAREVLGVMAPWQQRMRAERGVGWVYPADELYLLAGAGLPPVEAYDGFPQFENGIGMAADFVEEFRESTGAAHVTATVVTGELFAPVLRDVLGGAGWTGVRVLAVPNRLFGGNVSVAGLLCGADIADAVANDAQGGTYLVPDVVVNSDGLLLDDVPARDLAALAGAGIRFIGSDAASLIDALTAG